VNAEEFTEWEGIKKAEAEDLKVELAEIARKSPTSKAFGRTLVACLAWELEKEMRMFLATDADKKEFLAFKKATEAAQRLINKAITEE
jgi:uncharacterized membrane protein